MRIRSPRTSTPARDDTVPGSAPDKPTPRPTHDVADWPGHQLLDDPVTARAFFQVYSGDRAVVVQSPPGAGKTRLVTLLAAGLAHRAHLRVAIAAQTKAQALEIAHRLSVLTDRAVLLWAKNAPAPGSGTIPTRPTREVTWPRNGGGIVIGVTARWLFADPDRLGAHVLIVDEAWQCTHADLGALGALADQIVCVGDPGQIFPVVPGDTTRWAGSLTAPHLPAPAALMAAHGDAVGVVRLRHTWRLGPETTRLIQPVFYRDLPFTSRRPHEHLTDASGRRLPELAQQPLNPTEGPTDRTLIDACVARVRELLHTELSTAAGVRSLTGEDIAVVVPHVAQAATVTAALSDQPDVLVGTANALQGMERAAVVVLHPLAGYRAAEEFALDPGRACVTLSRHRAHATILHDTATPGVLHAADPGTTQTLNLELIHALTDLPAA